MVPREIVAGVLPTPWIGLFERINISVFLLWVVVLAAVLWRTGNLARSPTKSRQSRFEIPERSEVLLR
jgi:hypothetical protein